MIKINKNNIHEFLRFCLIGLAALVIDVGIYILFIPLTGVYFAKAISFISATLFTFVLNKIWTFREKKFSISEIIKFSLLFAVSAYSNAAINYFVYLRTNKFIAFVTANAVCMIINFVGLKKFVFNNKITIPLKKKKA